MSPLHAMVLAAGGDVEADGTTRIGKILVSEIGNRLVLERKLSEIALAGPARITLVARGEDAERLYLADMAGLILENVSVLPVLAPTAGALCTALLAVDVLDPAEEIVICNATELTGAHMGDALEQFRASDCAAGTLVFDSVHPRYSYVRLDPEGFVTEAAEKHPISRWATAGVYWFRSAAEFLAAAAATLIAGDATDGRFFVCPALNEVILRGGRVGSFALGQEEYIPLKDPSDLDRRLSGRGFAL
jgi:hypothetical protein